MSFASVSLNINSFFLLYFQLKYLEKDEFRDLRYLRKIRLDGNQLSVIIDNLFEFQKNLEHLGNDTKEGKLLCIYNTLHQTTFH